jgi:hypothetical protein
MSAFRNAAQFPGLYDELGIGWDLGCLMLDTESPIVPFLPDPSEVHISTDPRKKYVRGYQSEWHVTVRYGLLETVRKSHVDRVLEGFELPSSLKIDHLEMFPSYDPSEPYDCVVARVADPVLDSMNQQLSVLPNVNTFVEYKPHITIGYFRAGWFEDNVDSLLVKDRVGVLGFNYGNKLLEK